MKIYAVGGAVRDELLGLPVKDRDFVVVGSTPEEMIALGYRAVGKDFPVFLHPRTREEYALARTERKNGRGYRGFEIFASPEVTLEDDLARRDLTINAMARDENGGLVDPFDGAADIRSRTLRHVGPAFVEDPVRILRVARFAARLGFDIAPETMDLMRHMVADGEADHLVAERVWQEFANGLMADHPARMFESLRSCGALARILPELDALFGVPQPAQHHPEIDTGDHVMRALECAAVAGEPLEVRFALLVHDLGKGTTPAQEWPSHIGHESRALPLIEALCERVRVPVACRGLALAVAKWHTHVHRALELRPETILKVLEQCDAFRRAERFDAMLRACEFDARGRLGLEARPYPQIDRMRAAARAAATVDAGAVARSAPDPSQIKARVHEARLEAIRAALR